MAKEYFKRYVWLLQTLQAKGYCTFEELNDSWQKSSLNPDGKPMSKRTLSNHKASILDMFGIAIGCDRKTNEYYIENKDDIGNGNLQEWMLGALSLGSMLHDDASLKDKVIFEDVPSSQKHLPVFIEALKRSVMVAFKYKNPEMAEPREFIIAPYCVRLFRRKWYILGLKEDTTKPHVFGLDRVISAECTEVEYKYPDEFSPEAYYASYFGIDIPKGEQPEIIRIKASSKQADNLRKLPLHHSQKEIGKVGKGQAIFEYFLVPSSTFIGEILMMQGSLEILEPASLRKQIYNKAKIVLSKHI